MSRVILSRHPDGTEHIVVGWDHPAGGCFWQEWASKEECQKAEEEYEAAMENIAPQGPHVDTVRIAETGVKREGGMWPGIPLDKLRDSMPEEYRHLLISGVMAILHEHAEDMESGRHGVTDLSKTLSQLGTKGA